MSGVPNDQERQGLHTFYNGTDNDFQRNLLGNLGSAAIHSSEETADASGQDVDVGFGGDDDALRLLQQLAAEQSQLLEQLNVANSSAAQTIIRPSEQFLTIAANGESSEITAPFTICFGSIYFVYLILLHFFVVILALNRNYIGSNRNYYRFFSNLAAYDFNVSAKYLPRSFVKFVGHIVHIIFLLSNIPGIALMGCIQMIYLD